MRNSKSNRGTGRDVPGEGIVLIDRVESRHQDHGRLHRIEPGSTVRIASRISYTPRYIFEEEHSKTLYRSAFPPLALHPSDNP